MAKKINYPSSYLTMPLPPKALSQFDKGVQKWKKRPDVAKQVLDVMESKTPAHISNLYGLTIRTRQQTNQLPQPPRMKLGLGAPVRYFEPPPGRRGKTAVCLSVHEPEGKPLTKFNQGLLKTVPNNTRFTHSVPHVTVAYVSHGDRLKRADRDSLLQAAKKMRWTQDDYSLVDGGGETVRKIPAKP